MNIAIVGLGLIGGSIGLRLKLKAESLKLKVIGIPRRDETIEQAKERGAIDEGSLNISSVSDSDIVFICTPINLIIPKLKEIIPHLKKGAIVTDVGSSKSEIVKEAQILMPKGTYFVGGHPMAGKEKVKLEAAEADLFQGAAWILTQTSKTSKKALETLQNLISDMGADVLVLDPKLHDLTVAGISHMPLALAVALVNTVSEAKEGKDEMLKCASSGFRDTTRVASGDPELGVDIFVTNKKAVLSQIKAFKSSLSNLEKVIKEGNSEQISALLKKAKEVRDSIYGQS